MWQIRLTALDDDYDYIVLEEFTESEKYVAEKMLEWYQNKARFFNGTLSLEKAF